MKTTIQISRTLPCIAAGLGLALSLLADQASAQTQQWWDNNGASAATSGTWDTTTLNWPPTATLTASTAVFGSGNFPIFSAGSTTISSLIINVPNAVTCEGLGDGTTDAGAGSGAAVTSLNFTGTGSINLPTGEWPFECGGGANNIYINVPITGSGGIVQHNSGWLELYGNNTYTGGTWLTGGQVVQYNNNNAFGTGTITNSSGSTSVLTTNASIVTLPNAFYMNGNYTFNFGSGNTTCTGPWYLATSFTLKNNATVAAPLTLSGVISGAAGAGITFQCPSSSSAIITLSGANTFTGPTVIGVSGATTTLSVSSINSVTTPAPQASSSLGKPSSAANGTIAMGSTTYAGELIYTGSGETSDRVINLAGTTGGAIIEMDGTGPLDLTSAFTATGVGAKTLTLQGSSTANNTISGKIVDNASADKTSVTKAQAGTWVLSGVNTYTGGTTISGGALVIGGAGQLTSGTYAGTIANSAAFIYDSSAAQTLSGVISGAGGLSQYGSGNLTLSAVETYTGGTSNGVGSTLIVGGAGTITAAGKITNNGTFYYNSTASETISGIISGTGTLNLIGTGGLTLSGANTYTGNTTVSNGLLAISSDGNLGGVPGSPVANSITLNSGTTGANYGLRVAAATLTLNANRGITLGASGAAIQVAAGDIFTCNGVVTGSGNLFMGPNFNTGSGTLILGGANTYGGSTTIACGTLQLGVNDALPSGNPVIVASSSNGGILNVNDVSQTIGSLSSSNGVYGTGTTVPTIELGSSGALTIDQTSSTAFAGAITGGGSGGGITLNAGNYALTLSGTSTYSSATLINSGELIGVVGGGIASSAVTVSPGATNSVSINNNANQWTCGGLTFNDNTTVLDFNFGSSVAPSTIVAPLNVNGAVTFTGTPVVTIEAGSIPSGSGTYPLMTWTSVSGTPPTTVILPPYVTGTLSVSGNTLYLNAFNPQPLRWTGAAGNGLWDIATSQNWDDSSGTPTDYLETVIPGDAVLLDETYITAPTVITLNSTVTPASVIVSNTVYNYTISGTGGIAGSTALTMIGGGTLTLDCANTYTGHTTNLGGILIVGADDNLGTAPGSATVSSIVLSNSTLSADNTFTLSANRGMTLLSNSTLDVASGDQMNYSGIIAGPADLTKTSPGTLVLGGNANSYSGGTIITAGILQTGGDHATAGTASNLAGFPSTYAPTNITLAGGILQGNNPSPGFALYTNRGVVLLANSGLSCLTGDVMGIPGNITGGYGLSISNLGNSIVYLTGTNTYTGSTLIVTGLLSLQASGSLSNSSMSIAVGAGFDVSKLAITSYAMGGSSFTASGNGTVTNAGTANAAVINGAASGSVSLGSLPISLTFTPTTFAGDSTHPSLYVSQGTLKLNGNTFTVNNASATPLGGGTYVLIQQNGGSITSSGSGAVSVTGSGIVAGDSASIAVNGSTVNLIVNSPPTITNAVVTVNASTGLAWKIAITNLASLAGWGDPDGDTVTLSAVGPTSANGTNVTKDANYIYYNGPVTAADNFGYTVTDGTLTASGTVDLVPVAQPGPSISGPTVSGAGNPTFSGNGIPNYVYGVESATSLTGPWIEAGTTTADPNNGSWSFTDLTQTNPPTIFYRLYYPDNPSSPPQ